MDLNEARALVGDERLWPLVRDAFLRTGEFKVYPKGDLRRLELLDEESRAAIDRWADGLAKSEDWKKVLDGKEVKAIKAEYPDVYPEVFRYLPYFARFESKNVKDNPEALKLLLKLKFPEAYQLCFS